MNKEEKINLMLLALKVMGYNEDIEADGVWGPEAKRALAQFKSDVE